MEKLREFSWDLLRRPEFQQLAVGTLCLVEPPSGKLQSRKFMNGNWTRIGQRGYRRSVQPGIQRLRAIFCRLRSITSGDASSEHDPPDTNCSRHRMNTRDKPRSYPKSVRL